MTYVYNLKILQVNLFTEYLEIDSDIENKLVVNNGEGGEGSIGRMRVYTTTNKIKKDLLLVEETVSNIL